ncbi:MAG TPA: DUF2723 domain-containing protein [Rhodothermales bacterium]|nr:DUF2723 domain-containing protein [Rhodothermales bacterium]
MNYKLVDRVVAGFVFLFALVLYLLTMAPTASFWDCGEFIAVTHGLEVSHPPGSPFFMLVGRLFSMFMPTDLVAPSINLVSVLSSAVTVLLTFLIIVRLVREWQGPPATWSVSDRISALAGGVIGALTFAATDSFWFNAVEAEVYAMSMLFTSVVVWLILKWSDQARLEHEARLVGRNRPFGLSANRYLVLIAYMFGLAIGVHLLNLLAVFFIGLIIFFQEFDRPEWTRGKRWMGIVVAGIVSAAVFLVIYPGVIQVLPQIAGATGAPLFAMVVLIGLVIYGLYYTQRHHRQLANLIVLCFAVVLIGYSTYALLFIRSAANPPIDENDPESTEDIVSYLKREQYGATPLFKGADYDEATGQINPYKEVLFPRRWSGDPSHVRVYQQYSSDAAFFWNYQVYHMYVRYFLWNFSGKASDEQNAPAITGIFANEGGEQLMQTPSERASRNAYYGLPLLLGLVGLSYHFMRDWRRAFSVLVLFLLTGIGIIVYLNQPPLQPRERDYSYVASFFAFSIWVGIGATGIIQLVVEGFQNRWKPAVQNGVALGVAALLFGVPMLVTVVNYDDHDRSGNYVAPEYAYNMLQSVAPNGILFTNGDNDTFPLWYLQEVERVRTDVRVANLSLLNTPWYVKQLKNEWSNKSAPLPISLTNEQIEKLGVAPWKPREISLPVDKQQLAQSSEVALPEVDLSQLESPMTWTLEGRPYNKEFNVLYGADQAALDILATNAQQGWTRPVYFAVTVSPDGMLDLQHYLQLDGQAYRVVPIKHNETLGRVVPSVALDVLRKFKFTNLDNPDVYYDENVRRMVDNYRNIFAATAQQLAEKGHREDAIALLDTIMQKVPFDIIPGDQGSFLFMAQAYREAGAKDKAAQVWKLAEPMALYRLQHAGSTQEANNAAQFVQMIRYYYMASGHYEAAAAFGNRLADVLNDESLRASPEELKKQFEQAQSAPADQATSPDTAAKL